MINPKIYICTTFRDFTGSDNDKIQLHFLKSIESQTFKNIEMIVTMFGEKKVQKEIEKFPFKSTFFTNNIENFRYSLTNVLLNAINYTNRIEEDYIIFWTTCDVIYDETFFETLVTNYRKNMIGTSHPHTIYPSINEYDQKINYQNSLLSSGFDMIYMDKEFLKSIEIKNSLKSYIFNDWGVFEHFLISLNEFQKNCKMINLYEEVKIYKIENNRKTTNEPNLFLKNSCISNTRTFNRFLQDKQITNKYFDLAFCHFKFTMSKDSIKHYIRFYKDIFLYLLRKLMRISFQILPQKIQKKIRKW